MKRGIRWIGGIVSGALLGGASAFGAPAGSGEIVETFVKEHDSLRS